MVLLNKFVTFVSKYIDICEDNTKKFKKPSNLCVLGMKQCKQG